MSSLQKDICNVKQQYQHIFIGLYRSGKLGHFDRDSGCVTKQAMLDLTVLRPHYQINLKKILTAHKKIIPNFELLFS